MENKKKLMVQMNKIDGFNFVFDDKFNLYKDFFEDDNFLIISIDTYNRIKKSLDLYVPSDNIKF